MKTMMTAAWGLFTIGIIGICDYLSGFRMSFSIFYIIPILIVTWKSGKKAGYFLAAAAAVAWFFADHESRSGNIDYLMLSWNAFTRLATFGIIVFLLSGKEKMYINEKLLARTDPLTGLRNRRAFTELLEKEAERHRRFDRPFSVAYFDCDNFKKINDTKGHKTGDLLLQTVAHTVKENMRTMDVFARLGGDEFILLMPEALEEAAREAAERISRMIKIEMANKGWPVTLSIGIGTFTGPVSSADDAIAKTDALMYKAKNGGKDRIVQKTF